jgi:uncharacterized protein YjdB
MRELYLCGTAQMGFNSTFNSSGSAQPSNASNRNLMWSSSNENIATVNQNGRVTGVSAGTAIITATTEEGGYSSTATITVVP